MLRTLTVLIFFALGCVHTPNSETGRNPAGKADPNAVQTHAVDTLSNLFLWVGSPRGSILRAREASFENEVQKGNLCLAQVKRELEELNQDQEFQQLCRRYKAANDFLSNKNTACVIGVASQSSLRNYYLTPFIAAPYIIERNRLPSHFSEDKLWYEYDYSTEILEDKILHKNSYAKALEDGRCHIDREPYIKVLTENITKKEAIVEGKLEAQNRAKNLAALEAEQNLCLENFKNLKVTLTSELRRIRDYIPESMISAEDQAAMKTAYDTTYVFATGRNCKTVYDQAQLLKQRLTQIRGKQTTAEGN